MPSSNAEMPLVTNQLARRLLVLAGQACRGVTEEDTAMSNQLENDDFESKTPEN